MLVCFRWAICGVARNTRSCSKPCDAHDVAAAAWLFGVTVAVVVVVVVVVVLVVVVVVLVVLVVLVLVLVVLVIKDVLVLLYGVWASKCQP